MKDEFDELLEIEQVQKDAKEIKRKMNLYIYKRIGIVLLVFCLVIGGLLALNIGIHSHKKKQYFDPSQFKIGALDNKTSIQLLLSSYYKTQYPVEIVVNDLKKIDQDHYQIQIQEFVNHFTIWYGNDQEITTIEINKDQADFSHRFSPMIGEYKKPGVSNESFDYDLKKELNSLKELPRSSYLEIALSFDKKVNIKDFIAFTKKYSHVDFYWACLGIDNSQKAYGIDLKNIVSPDLDEKTLKKYPYIIEFDYQNEKQLTQHYHSCLQLLVDYPQFTNILFQDKSVTSAKEQYQQVKKEISFIGVKAYIKRDDLIKGIENGDMEYGMIEDIRYSKYER